MVLSTHKWGKTSVRNNVSIQGQRVSSPSQDPTFGVIVSLLKAHKMMVGTASLSINSVSAVENIPWNPWLCTNQPQTLAEYTDEKGMSIKMPCPANLEFSLGVGWRGFNELLDGTWNQSSSFHLTKIGYILVINQLLNLPFKERSYEDVWLYGGGHARLEDGRQKVTPDIL